MDIGIFVFVTDQTVNPAILARKAEELGFESFWVPEHAILPVHTSSPYQGDPSGRIPDSYRRVADPFVALSLAAAATKTIKLGTGICLVPERNPLLLAKEVATLDRFSGGRFIFGIAAGWLKEELEIMGADFPHRWTQTREAVEAMKELWTKDEAEYHGKYYDFPPVVSLPKPAQKPYPPIYLGGNAKNVFKRVVGWGDGWMPSRVPIEGMKEGCATIRELADSAGRDPGSIGVHAFGQSGLYKDRDTLKEMEDFGINRTTIWLDNHTDEKDALKELAGDGTTKSCEAAV